MRSLDFVLVGPGAMGISLAWALRQAGHRCVGVQGREVRALARACARLKTTSLRPGAKTPTFNLLLLTVPDDTIPSVCRQWARSGIEWKGRFVLHISGALTSEILDPLRRRGARCGSFHPLTSLPRPNFHAHLFRGVTFGLEGDPACTALCGRLIRQLGGRALKLSRDSKAAYHLAACLSSGYLLAYLALASEQFEHVAGMRPGRARSGFLRLAEITLGNAGRSGVPRSLTGPLLRGDTGTLRLHGEVLRRMPEIYRGIYRLLAEKERELAERGGRLRGEAARRVRRYLSGEIG